LNLLESSGSEIDKSMEDGAYHLLIILRLRDTKEAKNIKLVVL
jgi:hypothetical protein